MSPTNLWQVMNPIAERVGYTRWFKPLIAALHESDAIRIAEQQALAFGFVFVGDIELMHVGRAISECP